MVSFLVLKISQVWWLASFVWRPGEEGAVEGGPPRLDWRFLDWTDIDMCVPSCIIHCEAFVWLTNYRNGHLFFFGGGPWHFWHWHQWSPEGCLMNWLVTRFSDLTCTNVRRNQVTFHTDSLFKQVCCGCRTCSKTPVMFWDDVAGCWYTTRTKAQGFTPRILRPTTNGRDAFLHYNAMCPFDKK